MRLWSSGRLTSHVFEQPPYLIDPILPLGGTMLLHGPPNVGKTQLMLTLAKSIVTGEPFLDRWPTRQGPVVFIQADMTSQIQQIRVAKLTEGMQIDIDDIHWIVEEDGGTPQIDISRLGHREPRLINSIRDLEPVLTIWDSLRKIHRLPEDDSSTPVEVYGEAQRLIPSSTHSFVHHDRKQSRDPDLQGPEGEAARGAVGWKADSDTTMQLRPVNSKIPPRVILETHKARTAPPEHKRPLALELDGETMLLDTLSTLPWNTGQGWG